MDAALRLLQVGNTFNEVINDVHWYFTQSSNHCNSISRQLFPLHRIIFSAIYTTNFLRAVFNLCRFSTQMPSAAQKLIRAG